jgi:hypothetical protein
MGLRIFIIDDDDTPRRLSVARFDRLNRGDPGERLPEYAGRRMRCAIVILELEERRPLAIARIDQALLSFDAEGRIDADEQLRQARLAVETLSLPIEPLPGVIEAGDRFARRRYAHEFKWTLEPAVEAAIADAIFGSGE